MELEIKTLFLAIALFLYLSLSIFVSQSSASCMRTSPQPHADQCTYDGHVLDLSESFTDFEKCAEYHCQKDGSMSICGIGIHAGVMVPPEGCTIIQGDKCSVILVDANDHSVQCQFDLIG